MKKIALITAAAACWSIPAQAQTIGGVQLSVIDANDDGAVSRQEFDLYGARAFQALDTNGNGLLSPAEMEGKFDVGAVDADGDGSVTRQEFGRQLSADFAAADRDGNDLID